MARDTSPTDRRGYDRPALGDDWADAWDELVEDTDELAVERGPAADRPAVGAYDDALFLATDQRTLWRWDAASSDWVAQAGLGSASSPVPGTSHFESIDTGSVSTRSIFRNSVTVVSPGDDLQNRVDAADEGGTLLFEQGDHDITQMGTAVIDKPLSVQAQGGEVGGSAGATRGARLLNTGTAIDSPILSWEGQSSNFSDLLSGFEISGLVIEHEGNAPAIRLKNVKNPSLKHPKILLNDAGSVGIELTGESYGFRCFGGVVNNYTDHALLENGIGEDRSLYGFKAVGGDIASGPAIEWHSGGWRMFGGLVTSVDHTGVGVMGSQSTIRGTKFERCSVGVHTDTSNSDVSGCVFSNLHFVSIDDYCVKFGTSGSGNNSLENRLDNPMRLINGSQSGDAVKATDASFRDGVSGGRSVIGKNMDVSSASKFAVQPHPSETLESRNNNDISAQRGTQLMDHDDDAGPVWYAPGPGRWMGQVVKSGTASVASGGENAVYTTDVYDHYEFVVTPDPSGREGEIETRQRVNSNDEIEFVVSEVGGAKDSDISFKIIRRMPV